LQFSQYGGRLLSELIMPLVKLFYRDPVTEVTANALADVLPGFVAEALTCSNPDGKLTAEDVEIDVEPMPKGMRTKYDLHVEVEANDYPERSKDLHRRESLILYDVRGWFDKFTRNIKGRPKGWVWVKLFPARWDEI
jgi:hypothetical protein